MGFFFAFFNSGVFVWICLFIFSLWCVLFHPSTPPKHFKIHMTGWFKKFCVLQIQVISFATEHNWDSLEIYDGGDMTAPRLGSFSGEDMPWFKHTVLYIGVWENISVFAHTYKQRLYLYCVSDIIMKCSHFGKISGAVNMSIFKFQEWFSEENMIWNCLALLLGFSW